MTFQEIKADIDQKHYHEVALRISQTDIARAIHNFFAFLQLPEEIKQQFALDIKQNERDRGTDLGWRRRSVDLGDWYDNKEFFHYNEDARDYFASLATQHPVAASLLESADILYQATLATMKEVLTALTAQYPGLYPKFFPEDGRPTCVLRLLKYDRTRDGEFLAVGHYDRSSCTIAIAESAPGLRIGPNDLHLNEVTHREGYGLFFPGISLGNYTNNTFAPSWHDVVQKGEAAYSNETSRWAIVLFCSPPDPNYFDRATAHTPIRRTDTLA